MSDRLPCYANRVFTNTFDKPPTLKNIKKFIDYELFDWNRKERVNTGILVISITEKDDNWKKWIKVLQTYPQVTFTRTRTKFHEGNYWCFLACFPCFPE